MSGTSETDVLSPQQLADLISSNPALLTLLYPSVFQAVSAVLAATLKGNPGAVVTALFAIDGTFHPATGVTSSGTTLTAGGGGGIPNHGFSASESGTSSITGTSQLFNQGDYAICTASGGQFIFHPGELAATAATLFQSPNSASPQLAIGTDLINNSDLVIKDGSGKYAALIIHGADGSVSIGYLRSSTLAASLLSIGSLLNLSTNSDGTSDAGFFDGTTWALRVRGTDGRVQMGRAEVQSLFVNGVEFTGDGASSSGSTTTILAPQLAYDNVYGIKPRGGQYQDNSANTGSTWAAVWNVEGDCDSVRLIFENDQPTPYTVAKAIVSVSCTFADPLNPQSTVGTAALWSAVTFAGAGAFLEPWQQAVPDVSSAGSVVLGTTADSAVPALAASDWIPLPGGTVPRTDGGVGKLIFTRVLLTGAVRTNHMNDTIDPNTVLGGRTIGDYFAAGDFVTTPAGMPNNGLAGTLSPQGIQVLARAKGVTILGSGASLIGGNESTDGFNTFLMQTQVALSSSQLPISVWSGAYGGAGTIDYIARTHAFLNAMSFDIVVITLWTVNDGYNGVTQAVANATMEQGVQRGLALAQRVLSLGARPVFVAPTPKSLPNTISENTRLSVIALIRASGFDYVDGNPQMSDNAYPANLLPQYDGGSDHDLNDAGHAILASLFIPIVKKYLGLN